MIEDLVISGDLIQVILGLFLGGCVGFIIGLYVGKELSK
jgi:hypothetical protein